MSPNPPSRADLFSAIGDANRRRILDLLAEREHGVGELASALGIAQPSASQHLAILREAGLVASTRVGTSSRYRVLTAPLAEVASWIGSLER